MSLLQLRGTTSTISIQMKIWIHNQLGIGQNDLNSMRYLRLKRKRSNQSLRPNARTQLTIF